MFITDPKELSAYQKENRFGRGFPVLKKQKGEGCL